MLNNAGFGAYGCIESLSLEEIKYQYEVNVFGVARMIPAVLPHMRDKRSGLVINVSSLVANVSTAAIGWYASTKHALQAVSNALRMEVKSLGIDVVMIEPGAVKTGFKAISLANLDKVQHIQDYSPIVEGFKKLISKVDARSPGPKSTVEAIIAAIESARPKVKYRTTFDAKVLPRVKALLGDRLFDTIVAKKLRGR